MDLLRIPANVIGQLHSIEAKIAESVRDPISGVITDEYRIPAAMCIHQLEGGRLIGPQQR